MPGHLEKRNKGSWTIVIETGRDPATGKRKRLYQAFKGTKKEAEKEMARLITEIEKGTYIDPSDMTFGQFATMWLDDYGKLKLAPTTYRRYKQIIDLRVVPWLGQIQLDKLKPIHLQQFYKKIIEGGRLDGREGQLSAGSIIYHQRVIHRILEAAYKQELIHRNVADLVELPLPEDDDEKEQVAILNSDQIKELEASLNSGQYYTLVFVGIRTGLRRGELLGLQWRDIDFDKGKLSVRRSLSYTKEKGIFTKLPKNKKSRRTIDISPEVINVLRKHRTKQKEKFLSKGIIQSENHYIFCQNDGQPLHPDTISSWFPKYLEDIGLPKLKFHCLRHTHASLLLSTGVDIKYISDRLGHSSIRITYDIYSHLIPEKEKEAVNKLEELLKN
ncbi:tyrosine-type recombinase/integrase [Desulfoscipio geothermicus]|uniref:Site-specific recombinase XerD n=1 Tax=Desulfoscipio geothermicus DSM 3669 TaxID=1121426 RepID=A0A1I6ED18_9FIRM|nr:tyrosine-type recombinase/integrase [Desulfoscipio geothermicus]SFR15428.1 Site-specific recombinase XerD [Desulfoscipio geothermicus DSM 3669]